MIKDIRRLLDALTYFYQKALSMCRTKDDKQEKHSLEWQEHEQTVVEFNCLRNGAKKVSQEHKKR